MQLIKWLLVAGMLVGSSARSAETLPLEVQVTALFRGKALVSINGEPRLLAVGQTHKGVTLVAADSRSATVLHQGIQQKLLLNQRIGGGYRPSQQAEIQIWPDAGGMYRTTGTINDFGVSFLVDTGASSVAMNSAAAKRIGIDYRLRGKPRRVSTASAVVTGYAVTLRQVTVGELGFSNIDALVIEGPQPAEILLGMSYLQRLEISHRQGAMVLKQKF